MTIQVDVGEAKTRPSALMAAVLRGDEVVLNRAGKPVATIVPRPESAAEARKEVGRKRRACRQAPRRVQRAGADRAGARIAGLTLVTADETVRRYPVDTLW